MTASAAPRGGSDSVKNDPTRRDAFSASRHDSDTMTTVASKARTAFTPSISKLAAGPTTRARAPTAASAAQRSSPAGDVTASADPSNRRPSDQVNRTVDRQ